MTLKESINNWYQPKKKLTASNATNVNRAKYEMRRICESHQVLPSLVTECPHCQEIINQLNRQTEPVQDKLKPFIHNYAKLFCNETLLKTIKSKDFNKGRKLLTNKDNEKRKCAGSRTRGSKVKNNAENMKESVWCVVETSSSRSDLTICHQDTQETKKKTLGQSDQTKKKEPNNLKHKSMTISVTKSIKSNFLDCVSKSISNRIAARPISSKSVSSRRKQSKEKRNKLRKQSTRSRDTCSTSRNTSLVKHWSKSREKINLLDKAQDFVSSVSVYLKRENEREGRYVAELPERVRLSSTDGETISASSREDMKYKENRLKNHERFPHNVRETSQHRGQSKSSHKKNKRNVQKSGKTDTCLQKKSVRFDTEVKPRDDLKSPFVAKYVGKNYNPSPKPITKHTLFELRPDRCYGNGQVSLHNKLRAGNAGMDYSLQTNLQVIGTQFKNSNWRSPVPQYGLPRLDTMHPMHPFPGRNKNPEVVNCFANFGSYQDKIDVQRMEYGDASAVTPWLNKYRIPLTWNYGKTGFADQTTHIEAQKLVQPGLSQLHPPKYFSKYLTNFDQKGYNLEDKYFDSFQNNISHFNQPRDLICYNKFDMREENSFKSNNVPETEKLISLQSNSSYYKQKTRKFKSYVKPYNIESRPLISTISIQRNRTNSTNISEILKKYLSDDYKPETSPLEQSYVNQKESAQYATTEIRDSKTVANSDVKRNIINLKGNNFSTTCRKIKEIIALEKKQALDSIESNRKARQWRSCDKKSAKMASKHMAKSHVERNPNRGPPGDTRECHNRRSRASCKKFKKQYEPINARKLHCYQVEHVPKPLEALLSKIIYPGSILDVR